MQEILIWERTLRLMNKSFQTGLHTKSDNLDFNCRLNICFVSISFNEFYSRL